MKFIDRDREMGILGREWENRPSFVVLYGRRRVGKTRLLREFSKGRRTFFFTFPEALKEVQMREFREAMADFLGDDLARKLKTDDWLDLLRYLAEKVDDCLIVLDEFTYAIKSERKILSDLQRVWDNILSEKNVMLVLSGSLLGMMWDDVLSHASPLYGRGTRSMNLRPFDYPNALKFFSDPEFGIRAYMLVGGIPSYLRLASRYNTVEEFLMEEFLSDYGFFYDEPYVLLGEELRELKTYFSILRAIAEGNRRLEKIANFVGLPARSVYPYVETLMRLGFVEKESPVLGSRKVSLYHIKDPMLLTWFTITYPQMAEISSGTARLDNLYKVYSTRFEELAREFLTLFRPIEFESLGRWWYRGDEIDIVAVGKSETTLVEVKWKDLSKRDALRVLRELEAKAEKVRSAGKARLGLIAKSVKGKEELREQDYLVWDLEDILGAAR
ncbi:ATP-binding protein [Thermococcus sp. Bubb.Bath]|uniref:ATP-binding protein n=1 Tax=Thermococcus sp. Bubb.Bath TaxID=1638242 RepID=UPI0014396E4B|nr:ATP-binding protein [Thermococcus sp. Bubb.Bath]NJF25888.1 ATP-binding protein [Thermococcus sp. Bubb.Bath]